MAPTKRLAGIIGFGLGCVFLLGPPGCRHTPGHLPHPPGLSLARATAIKLQIPLDASVSATSENLARLEDRLTGRNGSGSTE